MKRHPKYKLNDIVYFARKIYRICFIKKNGLSGIEYDLESLKPDKKTGFFEKCFQIPEGFININ